MKKKKSEMINTESKSRMVISKKDLQGKNHGK
jgi:hypothetical protein